LFPRFLHIRRLQYTPMQLFKAVKTPIPQVFKNLIMATLLLTLGGIAGYRIAQRGGITTIISQPLTQFNVLNTQQPTEYKDVDFAQFWEVWKILEQNYLDQEKLKKDEMVYGAIKGMTSSLGDPYTLYLPPTEEKRSEEDLQGSFFGVGIQLGYVDNFLAVMTPVKGSPAEKAGVKAKDLILHVKDDSKKLDKDTTGWSLNEAVNNIRGDRGTPVILTLLRRDEKKEPFTVTLIRDEIIVPSAEMKYIDKDGKKFAHIALSRFGERTVDELNIIVADIQKQNPKVAGVVLDVRNNPGGFLDGAIRIASEFMKSGVVVTQQGKYNKKDYTALGGARLADYPLVIIVNGGSASASEILAGALRDQRGAQLVGEKSFGKGTVQDALKLSHGAGLHVTIARWLLPKGDWIHEQGISVNVEVKDNTETTEDEVLEKAVEELSKKVGKG
jgi:carboxyl-terminal processing protease